jgi:putative Holliday junction resolvase
MPIVAAAEIKELLAPRQRLMALDLGTKTIGLALSDTRLVIATPLDTLRRTKFRSDADRLAAHARTHAVGGLVLGLPVSMDGSEGPRCQSVRQFARNLEPFVPLPMTFWDERLSTAAVQRELIAHDMTRKRRAQIIDRVAAAYILQGFLDWLGREGGASPGTR